MTGRYILDDKTPVKCEGLPEWADWFEHADRRVAYEDLGESSVSTVFLGLDHNYGDGPPLLFETMIFGGDHDGYCERFSTWEEAEKGHAEALETARKTK